MDTSVPKTWLVTGVAGFIGSHLLERLLSLGQRVIGIDNFATGKQENLNTIQKSVDPDRWALFSFFEADIRDRAAVTSIVQEGKPDIVLHQAALGSVPRSIAEPLTSHEVNVDGFVNMLDAARQAGVRRFIYASSSSVYGDIEDDQKVEARIGNALSPYAVTKRTNEIYAQVYGRTFEMETVGLRYFNVFGLRQDPEGPYAAVIPRWLKALANLEQCQVYGDGTTSRDFCYVANVVQANLLAGLASSSSAVINTVVNIACGDTTSLTDLWTMLRDEVAKAKGIDPQKIPEACYQPFRKGDILHSRANIGLARDALGYYPTHSVKEGIEELVRGW